MRSLHATDIARWCRHASGAPNCKALLWNALSRCLHNKCLGRRVLSQNGLSQNFYGRPRLSPPPLPPPVPNTHTPPPLSPTPLPFTHRPLPPPLSPCPHHHRHHSPEPPEIGDCTTLYKSCLQNCRQYHILYGPARLLPPEFADETQRTSVSHAVIILMRNMARPLCPHFLGVACRLC